MISCAVFGCANSTAVNTDSGVHFHHFPKHPVVAEQWLNSCLWKDDLDINTAQVCSIHFDDDQYTSEYKMMDCTGSYVRTIKEDAVPTLNMLEPPGLVKTLPIEFDIEKSMIYEIPGDEFLYVPKEEDIVLGLVKLETDTAVENDQLETDDKPRNVAEIARNNEEMKKTIDRYRKSIIDLNLQIEEADGLHKNLCETYKKESESYAASKRRNMNRMDQLKLLRKVFSESQIKILLGKKKIYWSNDDMAVGYTIRHLSSKRCYTYLTKHLNVPLPALSSIKRWATAKKRQFEEKSGPSVPGSTEPSD